MGGTKLIARFFISTQRTLSRFYGAEGRLCVSAASVAGMDLRTTRAIGDSVEGGDNTFHLLPQHYLRTSFSSNYVNLRIEILERKNSRTRRISVRGMTTSLPLGERPMPSVMSGQGRIGLRLVSAAHSWMHADVQRVNVGVHKQLKGGRSVSGARETFQQTWNKGTYSRTGGFPVRGWPAKSFRQLLPSIIVSRANAADAASGIIQQSKGFKTKSGGSRSGNSLSKPSGASGKISQRGDGKYIAWWDERMAECQKSSTKEMIKRLDFTNLLGLNTALRMGSLKDGSIALELLDIKRRYPHEVILCRIGEFYEALGFDACLLVEYAGLNPMGGLKSDAVPKAGCPIVNLRQTLDDLTGHGFSVCIVEEVKGPSIVRQRKERFIGGHAHRGSPYVYGLAEADVDVDFPDPVPVVAVARSALGYYKLLSIVEMMRTISVEDQLTEEAVVAKLRAKCYQRLFLHKSLKDNSTETVRWGEFGEGGMLWAECRGKHFEWYENDPVSELLSRVRELYDLDVNAEFRMIGSPPGERPRPLYVGTASQVGVLPTQGVPSLLKVLLPRDVNGLCTSYLRDLLLNPPPHGVAARIQQAVCLMNNITCSIPDFICVSAAKLVKLIGAKEANHIEFSRLKNMAEDVLQMEREPQLAEILRLLLDPTWLATGLRIGREQLVDDCSFLVERLGDVLAPTGDPENEVSKNEVIPDEFFQDMEVRWKGRVRRGHVEKAYAEVDQTAFRLAQIVDADFTPIVKRTRALALPVGGGAGGARAEIVYSREHKGVFLKGRRFSPSVWGGTPGEEEIKRLKPAMDAKGKKLGDEWYTTRRVDEALSDYRCAVEVASDAVLECLKGLAQEIQSKMNAVVFVSSICTIAKTLFSHVSEARRRRWVVPAPVCIAENEISDEEAQNKSGQLEKSCLYLEDMFPYWLDKTRERAVLNTVEMSSVFLLTGPNGGGKSSVLRSVCAASLLATCGLMVPCRSASVPRLDSIMLRMMISDSPADSKSSFQMEMSELRSIVSEATPKSLVLYDELCKGTEVNKGTFIVASVLEHLDRVGCLGVISTHLHGLLDMQLNTKRVVRKAMGAELVNGCLKPTWKLVDGECRESLAFETARKEGVPDSIVNRAEEFYKEWSNFSIAKTRLELNETGNKRLFLDMPASGLTRVLGMDDETSTTWDGAERSGRSSVVEASRESESLFHMKGSLSVEDPVVPSDQQASMFSPQEYFSAARDSSTVAVTASDALHQLSSPIFAGLLSDNAQVSTEKKDVFLKRLNLGTETNLDIAGSDTNAEKSSEKPVVDIERAFVEICKEKLCQLQSANAVERIASRSPVCFYVGPGDKPPPAITNRSCVYILPQPDGRFYVGQTDNLSGRISVHRTKFSGAPFYYIPLPNKSVACEVETFLIHQLRTAGFSLANTGDQYHLFFGNGSPPF
ncbi:hypothetical protein R1flu_024880 [Riccia fluitans]|uniref:DNA mismatch repair proteins mutS family domain-containing protein n=1 Tax=Riccia fluitans TaxID=41844 RepID=A0ABD1XX33_9MARC